MVFLLEEKRRKKSFRKIKDSDEKFMIAKDKAANPYKYTFLKLKNLTE